MKSSAAILEALVQRAGRRRGSEREVEGKRVGEDSGGRVMERRALGKGLRVDLEVAESPALGFSESR